MLDAKKEMELCVSILKKFTLEFKKCKKDYDFLMTVKEEERDDEYKKAFSSVKERYESLVDSIEVLQERLEVLKSKV